MFWVLTPIGLIRQIFDEETAAYSAEWHPYCIYFEAELST